MLQPGIDEKGLNKSTVVPRILEYSPVVRAVAAALACQFGDCLQERFALRRIDVVLRRYKYRSAIAFDFMSGDRCRPLHRGRQVEVSAGLQLRLDAAMTRTLTLCVLVSPTRSSS